jgi:ABC-type bacteriocin/lantibiotic exporter with double-glycine peptidase domain
MLDKLLQRGGSWATELREPIGPRYARLEPGHAVVVDGVDNAGNICIRDPAQGTRYEMTGGEFTRVWTGIVVFRK